MALFPGITLPDSGEHLLGHLAVEPANAVGLLAGVQGEDAHREALVGVRILAAHVHKVIPGDTELRGELTHILAEQTLVEVVVTGGDGSVDGVEAGSAYQFEGYVEVKVLLLHVVDQALEVEQRGVPFVAVVELGIDAELLEHQDAADTEKILLLDTVLPVAAVELVGDRAVELGVHLKVGIHEVEVHAAHVHAPYMAVNRASGVRHLENHGVAVLHHLLDRELVEVLSLIVGDLLAVNAQRLGEITVAVKEADGGHRDAAVGSLLDIVAGEHAEAAGVDFQRVAQAVLHREVGDGGDVGAHRLGHILLEHPVDMVDAGQKLLVGQDFFKTLCGKLLEHHDGVFARRAPEVGVKVAEQGFAFAVPYPPQVLGEFFEGFQLRGQV